MRWPRRLARRLATHCEETFTYELITSEFIDALAKHIVQRRAPLLKAVGTPPERMGEDELIAAEAAAEADARARGGEVIRDPAAALRVLEVGAGNGELSRYLRRALHTMCPTRRGGWKRTTIQ